MNGIRWRWQDLRVDWDQSKTEGSTHTGLCTHGRGWLYSHHNTLGVEWVLGSRDCALTMTISDIDDNDFWLHVGIPFIASLHLTISRLPFVKRLPGVRWTGKWGSGERKIGAAIHHWYIWLYPWIPEDGKWWAFDIPTFVLGRNHYSERELASGNTIVLMPEGEYPATYSLFESTWKRSRWPWPRRMLRGNIEVEGGIPIPGKGENSWDLDDDATYSLTAPAESVDELVDALREGALHRREKYGWP